MTKTKAIIKITKKEELRNIILSGKFEDSIQVKNTEHICKDGSIYDYSEITSTSHIFDGYSSLISIPLFDTSNTTNMTYMFYHCSSLTSIPLLNLDNTTNISNIFGKCPSLPKIKQVEFFYQKDKLLLKSLELNPELFSEGKT